MQEKNVAKVEDALIPKLRLVLNGGSSIMDSATIPFRVGFSDEELWKKPTHILLINETNHDWQSARRVFGEREIYSLTNDLMLFRVLQPGKHRITVFAFAWGEFSHDHVARAYNQLLRSVSRYGNEYTYFNAINVSVDQPLTNSWRRNLEYWDVCGLIAYETVEIEVPDQVFAKPPEKGVAKLLWQYANWLYKNPSVDECAYRRRAIFAVLVAPVIAAFLGVLGIIFYPIYLLLAAGAVFLVGYRPDNIFKMWLTDVKRVEWNWEVRKFPYDKPLKWNEKHNDETKKLEEKFLPFYPGVPLVVIGLLAGISYVAVGFFEISWGVFLLTVVGGLVFGIGFLAIILWTRDKPDSAGRTQAREMRAKKKNKQRLRIEQERKQAEELAYISYLATNFTLDAVPAMVKIKDAPVASDNRLIRVVHKFYTSYYDMKGRICRPYAR